MANLEDIPTLVLCKQPQWNELKENSICIEIAMSIDGEEFRRGITVNPEDYADYKECHSHVEKMVNQIGRSFANVIIHKKFKEEIE